MGAHTSRGSPAEETVAQEAAANTRGGVSSFRRGEPARLLFCVCHTQSGVCHTGPYMTVGERLCADFNRNSFLNAHGSVGTRAM